MLTKTIKQTVVFKVPPQSVYKALMNSRLHAAFTGAKAHISQKIGGKIGAYDNYIKGWNEILLPDKKIVQKWQANEAKWPKKHYSKATFAMKKIKGGTRLSFIQSGVPAACYKSIKQGWYDSYWNPMKEMLEK